MRSESLGVFSHMSHFKTSQKVDQQNAFAFTLSKRIKMLTYRFELILRAERDEV